jgi:hypothetical protein
MNMRTSKLKILTIFPKKYENNMSYFDVNLTYVQGFYVENYIMLMTKSLRTK